MKQQHITPPPELVEQWMQVHATKYDLARQAAQWGGDQELEACRMEIIDGAGLLYIDETSDRVRLAEDIWTTRRPTPSLKEQALQALERFSVHAHAYADEMMADFDLLSRALEQLDD
jgi:hypothetical protein